MNRYIKTFLYTAIIAVSALLLTGCTPSEETVNRYDQLVTEANTFWEAREYSQAVNKFNEATSLIPSKPEAYKGLITIFVTKNRLDDAKAIVDDSANKLNANDRAQLYLDIGDAHYAQSEYDKALNSYELANGIGDTEDRVQLSLAKVYLQKGEVEKAKGILNRSFGDEFKLEAVLISSYIESLKDVEQAKTLISGVDPNDEWKDEYQQWSSILDSLNDDELFNSAKLSHVYVNAGYPYLAISLLEPMKDSMSEYIDGVYLLGKAYYDYGEYQKSIDTLVNVTSLSEVNQYLYWTVARDYYLINDISNSFDYYDRALTYAGDDAQEKLYQEYFDLLVKDNQLTKALEVIRKAEKVFDQEWVNIAYLKLSYLMEEKEKVDYYVERIKLDELEGNFKTEYLYWKSRVALEDGLLDEAKRNLDIFFTVDKFDPRYNLLMGQLSFQEGKLDEARNYLKKAIEYDIDRSVTEDAQKLLAQID